MVRDSMRLLLALALSAATFVSAGCVRHAYSLPEAAGYGRPSTGEGPSAQPLPEPPGISGREKGAVGVEVGSIDLRDDAWNDVFGKGTYVGARYSRMFGLNWDCWGPANYRDRGEGI